MERYDHDTTGAVIGVATAVHSAFGPGLLESAHERAMAVGLANRGIPFRKQVPVHLEFETQRIDDAFRMDLLVDDRVVVEIKAVSEIHPIHEAQLLTYLKLTGHRTGLILNFNALRMRDGIRRRVV